jgi:uncharacterized phiE125 gp8 family phage protein
MIDALYHNFWAYRWNQYAVRGIKVMQEPVTEPISVDDAALHCRIDGYGSPLDYPERTWIESSIVAARELVEGLSELSIAPQVLELGISRFPVGCGYGSGDQSNSGISLRAAPVLGIESVVYTDSDGADQTMDPAGYILDNYSQPAVLYPAQGASWPTAGNVPNAVRIRFAAGYSLPSDSPQDAPLPKSLRHAMLLVLGHLYENRENTAAANIQEIAMGVRSLVERYRIRTSMA